MKRYEASPPFRRMLLRLTWFWGTSFMIIAIVTTILIVALEERIAFGVVSAVSLAYVVRALDCTICEEKLDGRGDCLADRKILGSGGIDLILVAERIELLGILQGREWDKCLMKGPGCKCCKSSQHSQLYR
jgi:hypothetical protein